MSDNHDLEQLQLYVDDNLVGSGHCTGAAMLGLQGNVLVTSEGFGVPADEAQQIAGRIDHVELLRGMGLPLNGARYFSIHAEPGVFYGKMGPAGISVVKTNNCIVIGFHTAGIDSGSCRMTVEGLAEYMKACGL